MDDINKLKKTIWQQYRLWQKKPIYCPALDCNVHFSRKGWEHLLGVGKKRPRTSNDIKRRLLLLPYVRNIITQSTSIHSVRKQSGRTYYALETKIQETGKKIVKIRVIIVTDRYETKLFFSVMNKK